MLLPRHHPSLPYLAESLKPEVLRDNRQSWLPALPSLGVRTGLLRSWGGKMVTQTVEIPRGACEKWGESERVWESVFSQRVELSSRSAGHKIRPLTIEAFSCPPRGKRSAFFLEKKKYWPFLSHRQTSSNLTMIPVVCPPGHQLRKGEYWFLSS